MTHSGAGGPWAETDPTGLCRDRSDLRELLVELGTPGQGAARVFAGRHCQGYAAGSSEVLHGGEFAFPSSHHCSTSSV